MASIADIEAALNAVEREVKEVNIETKKVESGITETEAVIKEVEGQIREVDAQLRRPALGADEKAVLRQERQWLRKMIEDLRKEKELLRNKEELLRKEKELLRKEKELLRKEKEDLREQLRNKEEQLRNKEEQLRKKEAERLAEEQELRRNEEKQRKKLTGSEAYLMRAQLMPAPSQTSLKREQLDPTSGALINNWRPTNDIAAGLLPELVDPVFAKAAGIIAGGTELDQTTTDSACKLCCLGAEIYDNEAALTRATRGLLVPYLQEANIVTISSGFAGDKASPDWALGDSPQAPSNVFLIVEVKSGIGGSGDPHFQGANYHLHFWRCRDDSDTFRNTCCPAFLLEVVGPHVRLSAVAWLDRVTIFPLTPLLNLLPAHPVTDCLLMPVARMLAALRTGIRELAARHTAAAHAVVAHAAPATLQQLGAVDKKRPLPWPIGMDPRYDAATAVRLAPLNPTYYVRLAGSGSGEGSGGGGGVEAVAVKLCRKYGLAAHQAWAELGLAPQILRVKPLPGGWQLVEMEWLSKLEWLRLCDLPDGELGEALATVETALEFAHGATGMVHGDVRPPNCLVRRDAKEAGSWQVRFVDFEWAGREGEVTYPPCLNPDIPWPDGVGYGKPLQSTHDLQLLAASTDGYAEGERHGGAGPGAVRSLRPAARERCTVPLRKAVGVMLHRGMVLGWRQRAAAGWLRPASPGQRLVW